MHNIAEFAPHQSATINLINNDIQALSINRTQSFHINNQVQQTQTVYTQSNVLPLTMQNTTGRLVERRPHMAIDISSANAYIPTETPLINKIERGETWAESFQRNEAELPSLIIPGLYLGNAKTAAAYLTGRTDGRNEFPRISRIVTVLAGDYRRAGIEPVPETCGPGEQIQRLIIQKHDTQNANLLENFDEAGKFIYEGIQAFQAATESQDEISLAEQMSTLEVNDLETKTDLAPYGISASSSTHEHISDLAQSLPTSDTPGPQTAQEKLVPKGVLVHCHAGISRSATITIAHLLKYHRHLFTLPSVTLLTPDRRLRSSTNTISLEAYRELKDRAIDFVRARRPIICPNMNFRIQLSFYVHDLNCSITEPETGKLKKGYVEFVGEVGSPEYMGGLPDLSRKIIMRRVSKT